MKKRMTKTAAFLLALFLMAGLMAESAMAANEQIKIPATIIKGFYQENSDGFEGFWPMKKADVLRQYSHIWTGSATMRPQISFWSMLTLERIQRERCYGLDWEDKTLP